MNGLQPKITDVGDAGPDRFKLECPRCGEVGRHRFALLARRAFEEHADEVHPMAETPLDRIRALVDLSETEPGAWECSIAADTYVVRERSCGDYEVELVGRRATIDAHLGTLDEVRIVIGGHAKLVNAALATAATIQLRHVAPANAVLLE